MVRKLDAGPIVAQQRMTLAGTETGGSLSDALANLSGKILPDVVLDWAAGRTEPRAQDDSLATYTRELTKADGAIDWTLDAIVIERQIRAYQPWPSSWTTLDGKRIVIERVELEPRSLDLPPGSLVFEHHDLLVACGNGSLKLTEVRPEGKRVMPAAAWYRGLHNAKRPRFEPPESSSGGGVVM